MAPVLSRVKRSLRAAERAGAADAATDLAGALFPGLPRETDADAPQCDSEGADEGEEEEEEGEGEDGEGDEEFDSEGEPLERDFPALRRPAARALPTEDAFFKLSDMERFVRDAEEAEEAQHAAASRGADAELDEEDEPADADQERPSDEEDEDDDEALFFGADAGGADGAGSDEDLDAAVAFSSGLLSGKKGVKAAAAAAKKRARMADGGGDGEGIMYEDFFGPRRGRRDAEAQDGGDGDGWGGEEDGWGGDAAQEDGAEEEEGKEEAEEDAVAPRRKKQGGASAAPDADADRGEGVDDDDGFAGLSAHARRAGRLGSQIAALEAQNMGDKAWHMRGEVRAGDRPLNSALEVALDFEHAVAPPPVVTEEVTRSLEELIKARVAERRWDDVARKLPPAAPRKRAGVELRDEKSKKGLGELYEEEYLKERAAAEAAAKAAAAVAGGAPAAAATAASALADEPQETRDARALFAALCGKLDALSHFQFAPKPFVADLEVSKRDVPALAMEEVAPSIVSAAALRAPEEVYAGGAGAGKAAGGVRGSAAGGVKAEEELGREERSARRAKKKRKGMAAGRENEAKRRAVARERDARESAAVAAGFKAREAPAAQTQRAPRGGAERSEFAKSTKVFARLQESAEEAKADAASGGALTAAKRLKDKTKAQQGGAFKASALKL